MPQVGDRVLHFTILAPLGEGGMGQVFRAKDTKLDREVALKFLLADANSEDFKDRLILEAKSIARLDHPNIGVLHAIEEYEGDLFLVMALYDGEDLASRLQQGPLSIDEALNIFDQLLAGLGYAHERGIVHRDLKPANIFITTDGLVKVLDFGLAKTEDSDLTRVGQYLGTPRYSSPEHLKSSEIDQRSDIWSLGVLLFQLLTGALPFAGTTPQVLTAILQGKPIPLDEYLDHPGLKSIIDTCLQQDKDGRFESCHELAQALDGLREQAPQATKGDYVKPENPYQGLAYFREEDAAFFFGRDAVLEQLLRHVKQHSLLSLIGSSGSGKSSLVFAGLVPELREEGWLILAFRPGLEPFQALASSLLEHLKPELNLLDKQHEVLQLGQQLKQEDTSLVALLEQVKEKRPKQQLLVIIDQFEELYTFGEGESQHPTVFLNQLIDVITHHSAKIIMTIRADFMARVLAYRPMVDLLQDYEYLVGPLGDAELREVIEAPAVKQGASFEEGLIERILGDVRSSEGSLPLLEFTLSSLWEAQHTGVLSHQDYEALGGIERALAKHAEDTYQQLSAREQATAERVFLQLIYPGSGQEDTRRVATHQELGGDWALVHKLSSAPARLLITSQDGEGKQTAEIIHEALIRHWQRLRSWIDEHRSFRSWQEHLRADVKRWQDSQDAGYLLRGFPLEEAKEQLKDYQQLLGEDELGFINASIDLEQRELEELRRREQEQEQRRLERERLRQRFTQAVSAALIVAVVLAALAGWQWNTANQRSNDLAEREQDLELALSDAQAQRSLAEEQTQIAEARLLDVEQQRLIAEEQRILATFRGLEGQALAAIQNDDYALSNLLAAQGLKMTADDPAQQRNFITVLLKTPAQLVANLSRGEGYVERVVFSPDSSRLAFELAETVFIYDLESLEMIAELPESWGWGGVAFSPDSGHLITGSPEGFKSWDIATQSPIGEPWQGSADGFRGMAMRPDGRLVATGNGGVNEVTFWDAEAGAIIAGPLRSDTEWTGSVTNDLAFSPDGSLLVSVERGGGVILWDTASFEQIGRLDGHSDSVDTLAFSPDGTRLATAGWDERIIFWDLENLSQLGEITDHSDSVMGLAFSPDGDTLYSASYDKTVRAWDVQSLDAVAEPLRGHSHVIRDLQMSPDGRWLASSDASGDVFLWNLANQAQLEVGEDFSNNYAAEIELSDDGQLIAMMHWNNASLWDANSQERITEFFVSENGYGFIDLSSDSKYLASVGFIPTHIQLWDLEQQEALGEPMTWDEVWDPNEFGEKFPWSLAFSPDGKLVATGSRGDEIIIFWDVATQTPVSTLEGHAGMVAFSPDGKLIAGRDHGVVGIWDLETETLIAELEGHSDEVNELVFSPDGSLLASAGEDGIVVVWDVAAQEPRYPALDAHTGPVFAVAFSPDGKILASGAESDGILFWDVATGLPFSYPYLGHSNGEVWDIAFSPDGRFLISAGEEVLLWNPKPPTVDWQDRACQLAGRNFTLEEWQTYLGDLPYEATCSQFPMAAYDQFAQ